MNDRIAIDRVLAAWFEAEAPVSSPDGVRDGILQATAAMTPRPAWLAGVVGHHVDGRGRPGRSAARLAAVTASLVALVVLATAALVGSGLLGPSTIEPAPLPVEAPGPSPAAEDPAGAVAGGCGQVGTITPVATTGAVELPVAALTVSYVVPDGVRLGVWGDAGYITFREAGPSGPGLRGIEISDITDAMLHGSLVERPFLGTDAESFLTDLRDTTDFTVTDIEATRLGVDRPAWRATVSAERLVGTGWTHIDRTPPGARTCALEFAPPNHLIVADIDDATIAVQVWATTEADLAVWLPTAMAFVESLRFEATP